MTSYFSGYIYVSDKDIKNVTLVPAPFPPRTLFLEGVLTAQPSSAKKDWGEEGPDKNWTFFRFT